MIVDRAWAKRNLGFDPASTFACARAAHSSSSEDLQREIIDFDSEAPHGKEFLAFTTSTGLSRYTDVPWPRGLAPKTGATPRGRTGGPLPERSPHGLRIDRTRWAPSRHCAGDLRSELAHWTDGSHRRHAGCRRQAGPPRLRRHINKIQKSESCSYSLGEIVQVLPYFRNGSRSAAHFRRRSARTLASFCLIRSKMAACFCGGSFRVY